MIRSRLLATNEFMRKPKLCQIACTRFASACGPNICDCWEIARLLPPPDTPHEGISKKRSLAVSVCGRTKIITKMRFVFPFYFFLRFDLSKAPRAPHTKPIWINFQTLTHASHYSISKWLRVWLMAFPITFLLHRSIAFRRERPNSSRPSAPFNSIN